MARNGKCSVETTCQKKFNPYKVLLLLIKELLKDYERQYSADDFVDWFLNWSRETFQRIVWLNLQAVDAHIASDTMESELAMDVEDQPQVQYEETKQTIHIEVGDANNDADKEEDEDGSDGDDGDDEITLAQSDHVEDAQSPGTSKSMIGKIQESSVHSITPDANNNIIEVKEITNREVFQHGNFMVNVVCSPSEKMGVAIGTYGPSPVPNPAPTPDNSLVTLFCRYINP